VKNVPPWDIQKQKKTFSLKGPPTRGFAPGPGAPPPDPRAFPQLQIFHYTTAGTFSTRVAALAEFTIPLLFIIARS